MFPKTGKTFQSAGKTPISQVVYRDAIRAALIGELGGTHRATKTVMKWAGVSERTARNWISGSNAPAGEHLIGLIRNSDAVLSAVLNLADRREAHALMRLDLVRNELQTMLEAVDVIKGQGSCHCG